MKLVVMNRMTAVIIMIKLDLLLYYAQAYKILNSAILRYESINNMMFYLVQRKTNTRLEYKIVGIRCQNMQMFGQFHWSSDNRLNHVI